MFTLQQIDAILEFSEQLAASRSASTSAAAGDMADDMEEVLGRFHKCLMDNGWVAPFNWPAWQDTAWEFVDEPTRLNSADLEVIQKLLTTHIRKDRFAGGHLAEMVRCGHVSAVLDRLQSLRNGMLE